MKPIKAVRWLKFAENDLRVAEALIFKAEDFSNSICFHAQQCVEKSLKAILLTLGQKTARIHNLKELLRRIIEKDKEFSKFKSQCARLDQFYIPTRYPDALPGTLADGLPTKKDAQQALKFSEQIFNFVKSRIMG